MENEKIKDLATIRFGINAKINEREGILCLQGKDLKENEIQPVRNTFITESHVHAGDILQKGTILFSAKGNRHLAAVWNRKETAVASSTFLILTINHPDIYPEYLAWYFNQPKTQNYIKRVKKRGTISVISKKEFENIDVDIPPVDVQEKIIKIVNLEKREHQLMDEIKRKRKQLTQGITNKIFQK